MNDEQIIEATKDREIEALIAEKVMGWRWVRCDFPKGDDRKDKRTWPFIQLREPEYHESKPVGGEHKHWRPGGRQTWASWDCYVPHYLTSLIASKQLREKLAERFPRTVLDCNSSFHEQRFRFEVYEHSQTITWAYAAESDTEERAVAKCALRSVGVTT